MNIHTSDPIFDTVMSRDAIRLRDNILEMCIKYLVMQCNDYNQVIENIKKVYSSSVN
jgi:hypothetical protein